MYNKYVSKIEYFHFMKLNTFFFCRRKRRTRTGKRIVKQFENIQVIWIYCSWSHLLPSVRFYTHTVITDAQQLSHIFLQVLISKSGCVVVFSFYNYRFGFYNGSNTINHTRIPKWCSLEFAVEFFRTIIYTVSTLVCRNCTLR